MKRYHTATIARLLERYMAGTTTLSEERLLERYFLTATDIPREWAVYQTMFTQYARTAAPQPRRAVRLGGSAVCPGRLAVDAAVLPIGRQPTGDGSPPRCALSRHPYICPCPICPF